MKKDSKIYIAGASGLVGSAIIRKLIGSGYTNLVGTHFGLAPQNTQIRSSNVNLVDQQETENFFRTEKPEYVFLAAARVGGIVANNLFRANFIYDNLQIQNNTIHQSYLNGVKKLLFLGSSCIYPKNCPQPMREDYLLTSELEYTNEPYAIAKIAGIKMCESYNIQYNTNFISVMPTNLFGENDNFDLEKSHVLPALIRKMFLGKCLMNNDWDTLRKNLNNHPIETISGNSSEKEILQILQKYGIVTNQNETYITLWGTGEPLREFLHSDDLADACVFLMENIDFKDIMKNEFSEKTEIRNTHINIGTGRDITIKDLALMVKEITDYKGNIVWDSQKPDGTMKKQLDVSKLLSYGWKPKIKFKEGVKEVFRKYTANL